MWSLFLTALNTLSSPALLPQNIGNLDTYQRKANYVNPYSSPKLSFTVAQNSPSTNLAEAASSRGFLLKYSPVWQRYTTPNSDPNADILLARNFPSPKGEIIVKLTTTVTNLVGVPKNLPKEVNKLNISADFFSRVLAQSGYKVYQMSEMTINEKKAVKLVTETPKKLGSTIVLMEGKGETMVVSTSTYPIDNSIISRELLEQVMAEIGSIQNSITIR
jgi:hypothetical protein